MVSILESRIEDSISKVTEHYLGKLFLKLILKNFYSKIVLKQSDYREEIDVMEEIEMNRKVHSIEQVSQMAV